jgi:hypothetical protein
MRALLIVTAASLAAITVPAGSAAAEDNDGAFVGIPSTTIDSGFGRGFRNDRRRVRSQGGDIFLGDWEYTGNQTWRPDSFNDWWHERPNRAYPAWVQRNRDCQRKWWQGETLTC